MAVSGIPTSGNVLTQPSGGDRFDGKQKSSTIVKKGPYAALKTFADGLIDGDNTVDDMTVNVRNWTLSRLNGSLGELVIECGDRDDGSSESSDRFISSVKWGLKNVQMQLPLSKFHADGTWSNTAPDGHLIAMWRRETRRELYEANSFLAPDGNVYDITASTVASAAANAAVIDKYKKGIEAVMRFYPVITKTTTYKPGMDDDDVAELGLGSRLAHVDTPAKTFGLTPGAWLKIQDEAEWGADGTLVRVEGWQGCKSLDADLYGDGTSTNPRWEPMSL